MMIKIKTAVGSDNGNAWSCRLPLFFSGRKTMMRRIAKFEKVSEKRFLEDWKETFGETDEQKIKFIYEELLLPRRATSQSAGYDFFMPATLTLKPNETVKIPTGIRVRIDPDWVLQLFPRSGLGFKYRLQLNNTVGIIDSDYYGSDNEGHIFAKLTNDSKEGKTVELKVHTGFLQGIFLPYGITEDDDVQEIRNGGFGSTSR